MKKFRVLIVDDSALIRSILSEIFNSAPDIEVVGTATDPLMAREKIKQLNPDVLTLDIEMPKMDGLTFLKNLMRLRAMPVVMISTLTEKGAEITLKALELGAVDFVAKPKIDVNHSLQEYAEEIIAKVRMAANTKVQSYDKPPIKEKTKTVVPSVLSVKTTHKIIAIGSSTGGTEAIKAVVKDLPASSPGIVISQHLPEMFSASFAKHVNDISPMMACVAEDGQQIIPGHIYIAPGNRHLKVLRDGARYICKLDDGPHVNRHKPSVEVMFRSVAQNVGHNAIGVMLTGMGCDGAAAMKEMKDAGSQNIIQDEASSIVWGMPGEAYKMGAADFVQPLNKIAEQILALA